MSRHTLQNLKRIGVTESAKFSALLMLQTCSLSIALGGPWKQTLFFTCFIFAHIASGAITWLHIKKTDTKFSLPELIIFGFLISYILVGSCQLILRPWTSHAHLISALTPLLLAILLCNRNRGRSSQFDLANTTQFTTFSILLAAPIALSFSVPELIPLYIIPIIAVLMTTKKYALARSAWRIGIADRFTTLGVAIVFFSVIFHFVSARIRGASVALNLLGDDELFDFAHSRGFTRWGINENINFVGDNFRLYKFAQVWLGSLIEIFPTSVLITSTFLPILFFTLIALALWVFTFSLSQSQSAANIGSILIFLQASTPEPFMIERRPLYLISTFLIIVGAILSIDYFKKPSGWRLCLCAFFSFVIFSTRLQYALVYFVGTTAFGILSLRRDWSSIKSFIKAMLFVLSGICISYLVFYTRGQLNTAELSLRDLGESISTLANSVGIRVFIPLFILCLIREIPMNFRFSLVMVAVSTLFYVGVPGDSTWRYPIEIILIFSVPLFAIMIHEHLPSFNNRLSVLIFVLFIVLGFSNRALYDIVKWRDFERLGIYSGISRIATSEGWDQSISIFIQLAIVLLIILGIARLFKRRVELLTNCFLVIFSFFFGVWLAADLRVFTSRESLKISVLRHEISPTTRWIEQEDFVSALSFFLANSNKDDIFATNAHKYDADYSQNGSSLIITSLTGRRSYAEAPAFDRSTPSDTNDDFFTRMRVSLEFPKSPSQELLDILRKKDVKWFIVDLKNTELRTWEPWAKVRYINAEIAVLELALESSDST